MVPDRQKVRTDGRMDGRTDGRHQNCIPPTSSGDNKYYVTDHTKNLMRGKDYV